LLTVAYRKTSTTATPHQRSAPIKPHTRANSSDSVLARLLSPSLSVLTLSTFTQATPLPLMLAFSKFVCILSLIYPRDTASSSFSLTASDSINITSGSIAPTHLNTEFYRPEQPSLIMSHAPTTSFSPEEIPAPMIQDGLHTQTIHNGMGPNQHGMDSQAMPTPEEAEMQRIERHFQEKLENIIAEREKLTDEISWTLIEAWLKFKEDDKPLEEKHQAILDELKVAAPDLIGKRDWAMYDFSAVGDQVFVHRTLGIFIKHIDPPKDLWPDRVLPPPLPHPIRYHGPPPLETNPGDAGHPGPSSSEQSRAAQEVSSPAAKPTSSALGKRLRSGTVLPTVEEWQHDESQLPEPRAKRRRIALKSATGDPKSGPLSTPVTASASTSAAAPPPAIAPASVPALTPATASTSAAPALAPADANEQVAGPAMEPHHNPAADLGPAAAADVAAASGEEPVRLSRNGRDLRPRCTTCRERRRKCSRGRPCLECTSHGAGESCTYPPPRVRGSNAKSKGKGRASRKETSDPSYRPSRSKRYN